MKTYILGIDISTSIIGFAVMTADHQLITYDKLKFKKNLQLEERAEYLKNKVLVGLKLLMIANKYSQVLIES